LPSGTGEEALIALVEAIFAGLYVDNRFKTGEMSSDSSCQIIILA
jgi:hypothetical protein